jgi:hypothetical protein
MLTFHDEYLSTTSGRGIPPRELSRYSSPGESSAGSEPYSKTSPSVSLK